MKGRALLYSDEELAWVEKHKKLTRKNLHIRFIEKFDRPDILQSNLYSLCKRRGWFTGRSGQFSKGQIPVNKGKKLPPDAKRSSTVFKKGHKPASSTFLGHERVHKNGNVMISVAKENPHTGFKRHYVFKQHLLWEKKHGPLEEGMVLKCLSDDRSNCDPSNWEAIPRAMLPRLNGKFGRGYDQADEDVKPTIMAITKLEHLAREAKKGET